MKTKMKDSKKPKKNSPKNMKQVLEILDDQRLLILYLIFDVEATKREREYWKYKAGGK